MPCKQSDILKVYQTQFFALNMQNWLHFKMFIEHWKQRIELQWRLFSSLLYYWQSFFCNQSANQPMIKSMIKQKIKQHNDWNRMHCFLTTSHQKEYCFECQWWMMWSKHARLIQNILNHIKWWFWFPSFLSILRVLDWLIVGFILFGRQLSTCFKHCILFSLLESKEVSHLPVFSSLHSTVRL